MIDTLMTAYDYVAALKQNVEDFCADRTDWDTFGRRQSATWAAVEAHSRTMQQQVLAILRGDKSEMPA